MVLKTTEIQFAVIGQSSGLHELDFHPINGFQFLSWRVDPESSVSPAPNQDSTYFGWIQEGNVELSFEGHSHHVTAGMYYSCLSRPRISGAGAGFMIEQKSFRGLFQCGGPIESTGRLRYIDGCSDTLLIPPPVRGDACLNHLVLPPRTDQTFHTHPSLRFGMIHSGHGYCDSAGSTTELTPGTIFLIPENGRHRFRTDSDSLAVIAFHPDSDFGPHDNNHPMVNKTMMDGVSASKLTDAQRGLQPESSWE